MPRTEFRDQAASEIWSRVRLTLKTQRQNYNLSLRVFAPRLGVTVKQLCNLEQGYNAPTIQTLIRWCKLLDVRFFARPTIRRESRRLTKLAA